MGKTILIVEDEAKIREMIRATLAAGGHRLIEADGSETGLHLFRTKRPDLVILDVSLPDGSGLDICRKIRETDRSPMTPVIMLTAHKGIEDKFAGFEAGADQYLVKPISPKELSLWVQALLRRLDFQDDSGKVLTHGDLVIDPERHSVTYQDQAHLHLTVKEFDLLYFLVKHRPKVFNRKQLLAQLWHTIAVEGVVDVHISHLRRKLPPAISDRIQTIPGKGFRYLE